MLKDTKFKVGITGGIGAGKSLICSIISSMGYPVFNSDLEARKLLNTDLTIKRQIIDLFGKASYQNNELNRPYIAQQVFDDKQLLEQLNQLIHPAVRQSFSAWINLQTSQLVFNEAAILFETGGYKSYDYTILVTADTETRIKRVLKRDKTDRKAIEKRMNNQWSGEQKKELANFVIDNNDNVLLLPQVLQIINQLT